MRRTCLVLGSVLLLSGCSVLFLNEPPPGGGPLTRGSCTTSRVAPSLDGSLAAAYGFLLPLRYALGEDDGDGFSLFELSASLLAGAALGYSAHQGFKWTSECRARQLMTEEALADHLRKLADGFR